MNNYVLLYKYCLWDNKPNTQTILLSNTFKSNIILTCYYVTVLLFFTSNSFSAGLYDLNKQLYCIST